MSEFQLVFECVASVLLFCVFSSSTKTFVESKRPLEAPFFQAKHLRGDVLLLRREMSLGSPQKASSSAGTRRARSTGKGPVDARYRIPPHLPARLFSFEL